MNTDIKICIAAMSFILHCLIVVVACLVPFCTSNRKILYVAILFYTILLVEWYIFGGSVLNDLDKWLICDEDHEYKYHTGATSSLYLIYISKTTGICMDTLAKLTTLVPLILTSVCLYKLNEMDG